MIIAVDGPAASGKGTLAAGLARYYGLAHLDTGLLYRAVGLAVRDIPDGPAFEPAAVAAAQALDAAHVVLRDELQSAEAGALAARVATIAGVREALRQFQRDFARREGGAVLDGRDIGTVICPDADVKLFIVADARARAERRAKQFEAKGRPVDRDEILAQIERRDASDRTNPNGAFYPAEDAHLLDTTNLDIEAALRAAIAVVEAAIARKAGSQEP